ncbi:MAG: sigma-70 family RNA polymerase sigma factor [Bacteroidetes bacterium]|nr:sigma-70 family RNA polymerase sigma factor [Bacteroidota bacterium]
MTTQQIWTNYHGDIKNFIFSMVKDEQITNDLLQETFIKVHTKLHTLQQQDKIKSWLFTIARYTVLDYFKDHNLSREYFENDDIVEEESEMHNERDCLHGILKSLPKKYRDPLFLSDIKGMKQAEVASQLKLQLPTTKSRIQRARKLVAQGYVKCCDFKINKKGHLVGEIREKEDCKVCN